MYFYFRCHFKYFISCLVAALTAMTHKEANTLNKDNVLESNLPIDDWLADMTYVHGNRTGTAEYLDTKVICSLLLFAKEKGICVKSICL